MRQLRNTVTFSLLVASHWCHVFKYKLQLWIQNVCLEFAITSLKLGIKQLIKVVMLKKILEINYDWQLESFREAFFLTKLTKDEVKWGEKSYCCIHCVSKQSINQSIKYTSSWPSPHTPYLKEDVNKIHTNWTLIFWPSRFNLLSAAHITLLSLSEVPPVTFFLALLDGPVW